MAYKMVSDVASLPAPVGGWNARDSIANMPETDAVIMDNCFPTPTDVQFRRGWDKHATGLPAQVNTLFVYNTAAGTSKMYAAASANIYEVTGGGAVATASVTALTNSKFQYVNFTNVAGTNYLYAVNGSDNPLIYDGSTWTNPTITGFTASQAIHINVFKNRIWLVEENALRAWYLPTGAIQGTANPVDISAFTTMGGYLMAMGTWTLDAGQGVDDYAVFITSEGQVVVFEGSDPSSSASWNMKGIWNIGAPIGRRCFLKYMGDLLLICNDGVIPLSKALISSRVQPKVAITDKIQSAMSTAASSYKANFGWELLFYPQENMLLLNVPVSEGSSQQQYAMNTISEAWGNFNGIQANCWCIFNDEPYFGGSDYVGQFWHVLDDNGANIESECLQAFSYFKQRGRLKHFKEARPIISSSGSPSIQAVLEVDYQTNTMPSNLSFTPTTYATWDSGTWDSSNWGGDMTILRNWQTFGNIGTSAAVHFFAAQKGIDTRWLATDFIFERGGVI